MQNLLMLSEQVSIHSMGLELSVCQKLPIRHFQDTVPVEQRNWLLITLCENYIMYVSVVWKSYPPSSVSICQIAPELSSE